MNKNRPRDTNTMNLKIPLQQSPQLKRTKLHSTCTTLNRPQAHFVSVHHDHVKKVVYVPGISVAKTTRTTSKPPSSTTNQCPCQPEFLKIPEKLSLWQHTTLDLPLQRNNHAEGQAFQSKYFTGWQMFSLQRQSRNTFAFACPLSAYSGFLGSFSGMVAQKYPYCTEPYTYYGVIWCDR